MPRSRLAQGKQVPYDGAMDRTRKYVQLSRDIIFEGEMLWRLDTQMLHSHTGFEPYAKEWTTFADEPPQLVEPLRIALSHAWLAWTLLRWRDELQLPKEPLSFASPTHLDETLLDYTMRRDPKTGRFDADSLIVASLHRQVGKGARARLPRAQGRRSNLLVLHH
jgi:hypothetical protein